MEVRRYEANPIVIPGRFDWRRVATFNPAVIIKEGAFYMLERACSGLEPLKCQVGLLKSDDGFAFEHVRDAPVLSPEDFGTPDGTVEDPRVVLIDGRYHMTYVRRNFAPTCRPNGIGVPRYLDATDLPEGDLNNYRSGIAVSDDLVHWDDLGLITPPEIHDRDNILFPEKVGGKYVMLRRPTEYVGAEYGCDRPSIWISYSDDLRIWSRPELVASPQQPWEEKKIGAGPPPLATNEGWLMLYHGVTNNSVYRVGAMLLDRENPGKVRARTPDFIMEPGPYYERCGVIIPNVIFPSANVVKEGLLHVYYGCADTCISVATVPLADLLAHVLRYE